MSAPDRLYRYHLLLLLLQLLVLLLRRRLLLLLRFLLSKRASGSSLLGHMAVVATAKIQTLLLRLPAACRLQYS